MGFGSKLEGKRCWSFGQFLVRTKVISVEQLRDALDMMSRENLLLGQLAVEEGYLSESQANTINREQRYSDKPFGAIGVQMGLLTTVQLDQLLELQNKRRVQVGEALTRLSFISEDRLVQELRRFKAEAERPHIREVTLPGYLNNHRVAEYLLDLVPESCSEQAGCSVSSTSPVRRFIAWMLMSLRRSLFGANELSDVLLHQAKNSQQS